MGIMEMLRDAGALGPADSARASTPTEVFSLHWCVNCREHQVPAQGDMCGQCLIDRERGYRVRSMAGRCRNGAERDHGTRFHALPVTKEVNGDKLGYKALCGAQPGRRSVGWSTWGADQPPTCPGCLRKLQKMQAQQEAVAKIKAVMPTVMEAVQMATSNKKKTDNTAATRTNRRQAHLNVGAQRFGVENWNALETQVLACLKAPTDAEVAQNLQRLARHWYDNILPGNDEKPLDVAAVLAQYPPKKRGQVTQAAGGN